MGTNYSSGGFLIGAYRGDLLRRMPEKRERISNTCRHCEHWEEGCVIGEQNCPKQAETWIEIGNSFAEGLKEGLKEGGIDGQTNGDN